MREVDEGDEVGEDKEGDGVDEGERVIDGSDEFESTCTTTRLFSSK